MAKSEYSDAMFELKEYGGGEPWLYVAFDNPGLSCIGDGWLGIEFRDDVTFHEAKEFRTLLHKMVKGVSYTKKS